MVVVAARPKYNSRNTTAILFFVYNKYALDVVRVFLTDLL